MTENNLINGCQIGNREYQKKLYDMYSAKMLAVCYRYIGNNDIAYDLLHDGFVILFNCIKDYKGIGSFEGWIRRIFVNTALGYLRSNKKFTDIGTESFNWLHDDNAESVLDIISNKELIEKMNELPVGYRTVVNMYAIEGYSHKEIGEKLGIEEASSRSQFLRGKKLLKKILNKMYER